MAMSFLKRFSRPISIGAALLSTVGFLVFLYWLLPVAAQTRLSADHVRWIFSQADSEAVVANSLSPAWLFLLFLLKQVGIVAKGNLLFSTSAALSGWLAVSTAILLFVRWRGFHWSVVALFLSPWFFWTAVIPNGFALAGLLLVVASFLATKRDGYLVLHPAKPWTHILNFVEGFAAGLTPAAWILVVLFSVTPVGEDDRGRKPFTRMMRYCFILGGLLLHPILAAITNAHIPGRSVSWFPVFDALKVLGAEEPLGAAMVFLGPVGETAIGLLSTMSVVIAILIFWFGARAIRVGLLFLPWIIVLSTGSPQAWRLAHPGWNSILEDVYLNVERSIDGPTVAITRLPTEEAIARYVAFLSTFNSANKQTPRLLPVRPQSISSEGNQLRVQAVLPNYFEPSIGQELSTYNDFIEKYLRPNLKNGVQFWFSATPKEENGLLLRYVLNGVLIKNLEGPTQYQLIRSDIQRGYIRSRLQYREGKLKQAVEVVAYEPYAYFHLAMARDYRKTKSPTDWEKRAFAETYAALKKAPWLKEPYQQVCVEPELRPKTETELKGNSQVTPAEPLDVCQEIRAQL